MVDENSTKKVLILLNDTDPLLNRVTKNKLMKDMGWECIIAISYEQALTAFETEKPDIVITEILILDDKGRDGIELVANLRLKEKDKPKLTPVFVFSELDDNIYQQKALENGATAYYSKNDISLNRLIEEINEHISK